MGTGLEPRSGRRQSSKPPLGVAHRLGFVRTGPLFAVSVFVVSGIFRAGVVALAFFGVESVALSSRADVGDSPIPAAAVEPTTAAPAPSTDAASASPPSNPSQAPEPSEVTATPLPEPAAPVPAEIAPIPVQLDAVPAAPRPPATAPGPAEPAAKPRGSEWYGWQILLSDAASFTIILAQPARPTATIGLVTYLAVPPLIHFAHGNVKQGFASLALRVLLPPVGVIVGYTAGSLVCNENSSCVDASVAFGGLAGLVGTIVTDTAVLAVERPAPLVQARLQWRPIVMAGKNDTRIGVAGTF